MAATQSSLKKSSENIIKQVKWTLLIWHKQVLAILAYKQPDNSIPYWPSNSLLGSTFFVYVPDCSWNSCAVSNSWLPNGLTPAVSSSKCFRRCSVSLILTFVRQDSVQNIGEVYLLLSDPGTQIFSIQQVQKQTKLTHQLLHCWKTNTQISKSQVMEL